MRISEQQRQLLTGFKWQRIERGSQTLTQEPVDRTKLPCRQLGCRGVIYNSSGIIPKTVSRHGLPRPYCGKIISKTVSGHNLPPTSCGKTSVTQSKKGVTEISRKVADESHALTLNRTLKEQRSREKLPFTSDQGNSKQSDIALNIKITPMNSNVLNRGKRV